MIDAGDLALLRRSADGETGSSADEAFAEVVFLILARRAAAVVPPINLPR